MPEPTVTDIRNIRERRTQLEQKIIGLIREFEKETTCSVKNLEVTHQESTRGLTYIDAVRLDVRLDAKD